MRARDDRGKLAGMYHPEHCPRGTHPEPGESVGLLLRNVDFASLKARVDAGEQLVAIVRRPGCVSPILRDNIPIG